MSITIRCPNCDEQHNIEESKIPPNVKLIIKCKRCRESFRFTFTVPLDHGIVHLTEIVQDRQEAPTKKRRITRNTLLRIFISLLGISLFAALVIPRPSQPPPKQNAANTSLPIQTYSPSNTDVSASLSSSKTSQIIDEKKALQDSFFGDFRNAKITKTKGQVTVQVWHAYIEHMNKNLLPGMGWGSWNGIKELLVVYDEMWKWEDYRYMTATEKKQYGPTSIVTL